MHNKKITVKEVKKDFEGIIASRFRELKLLKNIQNLKFMFRKQQALYIIHLQLAH